VSAFLLAAGAIVAFYAVMAVIIAATTLTRRARRRAQLWQVSPPVAAWRASLPPHMHEKLFARTA